MSDIFSRIQKLEHELEQEQRQLGFQERVVKQLLKYAGLPLYVSAAKREASNTFGNMDLGFEWFHHHYPAFPVTLLSQKMKSQHTVTLADLYGKGSFQKLRWWREYLEQSATMGLDLRTDRCALFFNLPYAKDAFLMVLHNQPVQGNSSLQDAERREEPWPRTTFPMKTGVTAVLEAFPSFMQTVGREWATSHHS